MVTACIRRSGLMPLADISTADFARNIESVAGTPGVADNFDGRSRGRRGHRRRCRRPGRRGGRWACGSTIKTDSPGEPAYGKTVSATITFRAGDLEYTTDVSVFDVEDAEEFVGKVRDAAGLPPRV